MLGLEEEDTSVAAARGWALAALRAAGIDTADIDVRRLLAATLGVSAAHLLARPELRLSAEEAQLFAARIQRRLAREPVSRILGRQQFYGRSFAVSPATLDPRPDSEALIEAALEIVGLEGWTGAPLRILDIGTGTGCLLLTLLAELPQAYGVGTDLSPAALAVARDNATTLGLEGRVTWCAGDLLENVDGDFHMVLCNPPYLRSAEIAMLEPEVSRFDPRLALDGGADGLQIFRRLSARISGVIGRGWILLEVGAGQAEAVADLLRQAPAIGSAADVRFYTDVSGRRRCVAARTRN